MLQSSGTVLKSTGGQRSPGAWNHRWTLIAESLLLEQPKTFNLARYTQPVGLFAIPASGPMCATIAAPLQTLSCPTDYDRQGSGAPRETLKC